MSYNHPYMSTCIHAGDGKVGLREYVEVTRRLSEAWKRPWSHDRILSSFAHSDLDGNHYIVFEEFSGIRSSLIFAHIFYAWIPPNIINTSVCVICLRSCVCFHMPTRTAYIIHSHILHMFTYTASRLDRLNHAYEVDMARHKRGDNGIYKWNESRQVLSSLITNLYMYQHMMTNKVRHVVSESIHTLIIAYVRPW